MSTGDCGRPMLERKADRSPSGDLDGSVSKLSLVVFNKNNTGMNMAVAKRGAGDTGADAKSRRVRRGIRQRVVILEPVRFSDLVEDLTDRLLSWLHLDKLSHLLTRRLSPVQPRARWRAPGKPWQREW
jgi:hypothetical protein